MPRRRRLCLTLAALALGHLAAAPRLMAQGIDLTVNHAGIGIGDVPRVTGIRVNVRDRSDFDVHGINATLWSPEGSYQGNVSGFALGLPLTGASRITGIGAGVFGVGAEEYIDGIGVGGIGLGAGGRLRGIMLGGLGVGAGGDITGVTLGGLAVGSGRDVRGVTVAGAAVGSGGDVLGLTVGGLAAGSGRRITGITIAGLAAGSGDAIRGLTLAGVAIGAGRSIEGITAAGLAVGTGDRLSGLTVAGAAVGSGEGIRGVTIAGLGIGSGGTIRWASLAGLGIGAPRIEGFAAAPVVGAESMRAFVIAPAYLRLEDGTFEGVSLSAFNHVKGTQRGLTIGIVNYAWRLRGVQLGVLNYARDNPRPLRLLPIANVHVQR